MFSEGVRNISNQLSITTKMDVMSPNLVEEATAEKLYKPKDGPFNFAKVFSEFYIDPAKSFSDRFSCGRRLLKEYSKDGKIATEVKMERSGSIGRVLDMGSKSSKFKTHRRHCVVFLSKTIYPLICTGSRQESVPTWLKNC